MYNFHIHKLKLHQVILYRNITDYNILNRCIFLNVNGALRKYNVPNTKKGKPKGNNNNKKQWLSKLQQNTCTEPEIQISDTVIHMEIPIKLGKQPLSRPIVPTYQGSSTGMLCRASPRTNPASRGDTSVCPEYVTFRWVLIKEFWYLTVGESIFFFFFLECWNPVEVFEDKLYLF